MAEWYDSITPPSDRAMQRVGATNWRSLIVGGEMIATAIFRKLRDNLGEDLENKKILDFGCGVGRVALHLHHRCGAPSHGCDVNAEAVEYLDATLKDVECKVNGFEPPLPYEDNFFDALYGISIFTHLSPRSEAKWLTELKRVLRPGGVALLSVSGPVVLARRKSRGDAGWENVTVEKLKAEGMIFKPYKTDNEDWAPGVTAEYGLTAHDPDYIQRVWGEHSEVLGHHSRAIHNIQDLVVLRKR